MLPDRVRKTAKGIAVTYGRVKHFYRDGNYPDMPSDPGRIINRLGYTAGQRWHWDLEGYVQNRIETR